MADKVDNVSNKLIVMYILKMLNIPVKSIHLTKIVLENRFMNYFDLQQILNELLATSFIKELTFNDSPCFELTDAGDNSLEMFVNRVPLAIKNYMVSNVSALKSSILNDSLVSSNITEAGEDVKILCSIHENDFSLIDLALTVGTRADAQLISNNWKRFSQQIYAEIIESLTKKRT